MAGQKGKERLGILGLQCIQLLLAAIWLFSASSITAQEEMKVEIGGGEIEVLFSSTEPEPLRKLVLTWVNSAARAVTVYYQQFPVSNLRIRVRFFEGHGVRGGRTTGQGQPLITIAVGRASTSSDFTADWMLTHEMVHLAFPSVPEEHHWIEEGSATYVEPIARLQAGDLTAEKVWGDLVDGLPKGLPQAGDRGLDLTPTWGRTYWGGALFCLLADIEIRRLTDGRKGLQTAFRAILKKGGTIESDWPIRRALAIGDEAIGVGVLQDLYEKMRASPNPIDLDALWKQLGVIRRGDKIEFDEQAPLATIRKAITTRKTPDT